MDQAQLEVFYKHKSASSHGAALQAIFDAGMLAGAAGVQQAATIDGPFGADAPLVATKGPGTKGAAAEANIRALSAENERLTQIIGMLNDKIDDLHLTIADLQQDAADTAAGNKVTDGGLNPFYEGLHPGETEMDREVRLTTAYHASKKDPAPTKDDTSGKDPAPEKDPAPGEGSHHPV